MSAREELTKHYGGESEHWHGLLDAYRAEVATAFAERFAKETRGCCPECDAMIEIARRLAAAIARQPPLEPTPPET